MYGMRSPYQDPTFTSRMRMASPMENLYGQNNTEAYLHDTLRSGKGHDRDQAMMRQLMTQQQEQLQLLVILIQVSLV